jgi:hypothetical protein
VVARCKDCQTQWTVTEPVFTCKACQSGAIDMLSGRELDIKSIEIEERSDGFVKNPISALRFAPRHCGVLSCTPLSSGLASLDLGFFTNRHHNAIITIIKTERPPIDHHHRGPHDHGHDVESRKSGTREIKVVRRVLDANDIMADRMRTVLPKKRSSSST